MRTTYAVLALFLLSSCAEILGIEKTPNTNADAGVERLPECIGPADCPGEDNDCQYRVCAGDSCGIEFAPQGTPAFEQIEGDCHAVVCDGIGGTEMVIDDTDAPLDGNECSDDVCINGIPSNPPSAIDSPCGTDLLCNGAGECVGCTVPANCGTDTFCQTFSCSMTGVCGFALTAAGTPLPAADQTDNNCQVIQCNINGEAVTANDNADIPVEDGNECTNQACVNGAPDYPATATNSPCSVGGTLCNGAGACVECNINSQCAAPACQTGVCSANSCSTQNMNNGTSCTDGAYCNGTETCSAGVCGNSTGNPCPGADNDNNCAESCNEAADNCTANDTNGSACSDGLYCTGSNMTCSAGTCGGGTPPCPGADMDLDCSETCNEGADNCSANDPNGSTCQGCLSGQTLCESGMCTGGNCAGVLCVGAGQQCP